MTTCPGCGKRNRVPVAAKGRVRCAQCHADLPWLVDVDDTTFQDAVLESRTPVLVDVWAPWCGPCRMVGPVVEELSRERAGRLKVAKVNADDSPGTSSRLGVQGIPTLVLYVDGQERDRVVGAQPGNVLRQWVDRHLA